MSKNNTFYVLVVGFFCLFIWLVLQQGHALEASKLVVEKAPSTIESSKTLLPSFIQKLQIPFAIFLLQIITVILAARLFSWLAIKIRQPSVIGEIIAGIVLGPSLVGFIFPDVYAFIFPPSSISNLHFLSQIGLILFMFIVGMELDMQILKRQSKAALIISHTSISFSFFFRRGIS